jgi:hypothetical protein
MERKKAVLDFVFANAAFDLADVSTEIIQTEVLKFASKVANDKEFQVMSLSVVLIC